MFLSMGLPKRLPSTGSQVSGETVWVYFETGGVSDINTLKIKNTILLSAFPKQINSVNIAYKGSQKTMNFQRGKEVNEVSFKRKLDLTIIKWVPCKVELFRVFF